MIPAKVLSDYRRCVSEVEGYMRGMSKAAKADAYDALSRERDAYVTFAWHVANGHEPDAVEEVRQSDGDGVHVFKLYEVTRADGGLLVAVYTYPGQTHSVECIGFDDWNARCEKIPYGVSDDHTNVKLAAERLRAARHILLEKHYAKKGA